MIGRSSEKRSRKWLVVLAVIIVLAAGICSVNIRQVTVTGNSRYTEKEIVDMIFQKNMDWNSTYCYLQDHVKDHQQIPFVEDYKLVFQNPFHVQVIIHEKTVVGYVSYMSSFMYFDKDGIVVESTNQKLDGIPCITGLKFGHIVLHQPLPVEEKSVFESILNVTQVLETYNLKVDKIQYNSKGEATLYMKDLEVALGDSKDISGKISELSDMMPELEGKKGILYLDTYDPVNPPSMYTMKRKPYKKVVDILQKIKYSIR